MGARSGAFVVDLIASALVAALFVSLLGTGRGTDRLPQYWSLIPFAVDYVVGVVVLGRTLGMNLFGLRVAKVVRSGGTERVDGAARIDPLHAVVRTILLALLVPALIWDRDKRGLHDRFADTVVVRA